MSGLKARQEKITRSIFVRVSLLFVKVQLSRGSSDWSLSKDAMWKFSKTPAKLGQAEVHRGLTTLYPFEPARASIRLKLP